MNSVAPQERVNIRYKSRDQDVELPFKLLVIGEFSFKENQTLLGERTLLEIGEKGFDSVMKDMKVRVYIDVEDLMNGLPHGRIQARLEIESLNDMTPDRIVEKVPEMKRQLALLNALLEVKSDLADPKKRHLLREKIKAALKDDALVEILRNTEQPAPGGTTPIENQALVLVLLSARESGGELQAASIDEQVWRLHEKLARQTDTILHAPAFQKVEAAWRGLQRLVATTDFRESCKIAILDVSKNDLLADLEDKPDITRSGFYRHVYSSGLGCVTGEPIGAVIANYEFGPGARDIKLLRKCAAVASMAHAPFISAASPTMFDDGWDDFSELPTIKDVKTNLGRPELARWRVFREEADARYVGLTMPRYIVRPLWDRTGVQKFTYEENVSRKHEHFLWGNTAFLFAARLMEAFAHDRWCANIVGPLGGGAVKWMSVRSMLEGGAEVITCPTDAKISIRLEFELSEAGFIPLVWAEDSTVFFSAASAKKAKKFRPTPEGNEAAASDFLGTQLPYTFIISRLAHYVKRLQVEAIGTHASREKIQNDINDWIRQYINPIARNAWEMARWPLKNARVTVIDVEDQPGWYEVSIEVQPHFKYMGANFTLSLVGKMDHHLRSSRW